MSKIDINQRIPLSILEIALKDFLNDKYDPDYLKEQLIFEFNGINRIEKSLVHIKKVITKNPLLDLILASKDEVLYALKNKGDKSIILISMINATYPFAFDTLNIFAKHFKVQDYINTNLVNKEIKNKYGSNRSTENALYSVIPMFVEADFLQREKPGLYKSKEKKIINYQITYKLYLKSYFLNNPLLENSYLLEHEPYFSLIEKSE